MSNLAHRAKGQTSGAALLVVDEQSWGAEGGQPNEISTRWRKINELLAVHKKHGKLEADFFRHSC